MKDVLIYTSDGCSFCHAAKDFFDKNNVEYTEKNVSTDKDARKELMAKGHMGVPVIVIGEEELVGFDEAKVKEALGM
ncbi:MAG: glutaredoxin family protein [Tissierellia bacterium]|nr:glutaredoxin family protein [Tissierellia bacterium]